MNTQKSVQRTEKKVESESSVLRWYDAMPTQSADSAASTYHMVICFALSIFLFSNRGLFPLARGAFEYGPCLDSS